MQIEPYTTQMAEEVATLIEEAFAEHRQGPPLSFMNPHEPWTPREELLDMLTSDDVCAEASHVALKDRSPVSVAVAVGSDDECGWWRIATAPDHRREGLATRCIAAGESALRNSGQQGVRTEATVDSRWAGARALFDARGYQLADPSERNITMVAKEWAARPVELPGNYALDTLSEDDLDEWIEVRNAVFGSERTVEWFRGRFMERDDYNPADWKLVRHEGRIVGIASAICVEGKHDPEHLRGAQIEWVGVLDEHRGRRLGEALMVACMNHAAERGFLPILLITQPFRVPAVSLYEKLGFRTIAAWQRWQKPLR